MPGPSTRRRLPRRAVLLITLSAGACAVGPDFREPELSPNASLTQTPLPTRTVGSGTGAGAAQTLLVGRDLPHDWWTVFGSPTITALVTQALQANPDLRAAEASLRQAQETALAARGGLFPSASLRASRTRVGFSAASIGQTYTEVFTLSTGQLSISYPLDLFGGTRRQIEAAQAQAEYQRFQMEAAYLTISSNVVVAAIQEASLRSQIAATEDIIATRRRGLDLVRRQFTLGGISGADVASQEAALAQAETGLPPLRRQLAQQRDLVHRLTGRFPGEADVPTIMFSDLRLPEDVPVSLPSALVEQRPDIRSAAAQLHAATAQVGIATANMLPQISLSAMLGRISLGELFQPGSFIWDYGASVTQPLFQGGQLVHQKRASEAGLDAALAAYRGAVLGAFRNVADALHALQADAEAVRAQRAAERAAAASLRIAEAQFRAGGTSFLTLLNAQTTHAQARIALIQAETNRFADTAALYQALGGGWWNRPAETGTGAPEASEQKS
ncbi:MAG: efflux transporter outer membrane subunit [Acetobacteraceae bacterium]